MILPLLDLNRINLISFCSKINKINEIIDDMLFISLDMFNYIEIRAVYIIFKNSFQLFVILRKESHSSL